MTTRPVSPQTGAGEIIQFPDVPPEEMTAFDYVNAPGYPPSLAAHFGSPETTIITSEVAAALIPSESYAGVRYPDLLIAFNVSPPARQARNGYLIPEQGKPPEFVLEVASASTGRRDETIKGFPSTGVSTLLEASITALTWLATGWWTALTGPSPSTEPTKGITGGEAKCLACPYAGKKADCASGTR